MHSHPIQNLTFASLVVVRIYDGSYNELNSCSLSGHYLSVLLFTDMLKGFSSSMRCNLCDEISIPNSDLQVVCCFSQSAACVSNYTIHVKATHNRHFRSMVVVFFKIFRRKSSVVASLFGSVIQAAKNYSTNCPMLNKVAPRSLESILTENIRS